MNNLLLTLAAAAAVWPLSGWFARKFGTQR